MVNIEINLAVSGVTTIPIANTETEVILHVWYDGNDTFYHNIHRVFLENENNIDVCQVWFQQIGQVETEAQLLLAGAIRIINIAPDSKKTLIIMTVDKTKIGGARFFAENVSGNSEIDTSSFVTQDSLNQTVNQIYNDLSLTAEKIIQNSTNPVTSNSSLELTNDLSLFYVQTNTIDYVTDEIYTDWDLNAQPLTLIDNTTIPFVLAEYNALFADYPRPIYDLKPFHDLNLQNLAFYVIRNFEGFYLIPNGIFSPFVNPLTPYFDRFGLILNTASLTEKFVKIDIEELAVISGSPIGDINTFPLQPLIGADRNTRKYSSCNFKIWKDNNSSRNNIIFSIPLTDTQVNSTKTTNTLSKIAFWINNNGWYVGLREEANQLFSPITQSYNISVITSVNLEDGMDMTILPLSFVKMDPLDAIAIPVGGNILSLNNTNLTQKINFKLRLVFSGLQNGTVFFIRQNLTTIYTYTVVTTNSAQPNVLDLLITANNSLITIIPTIEVRDQNYYDWAFDSNNYALSVFRMMKEPSTALSTIQYNSLEPDQNLRLFINLANQIKYIFLKNLSFFAVRNIYQVFDSNDTFVYTTFQYQNRMLIGLQNIPNATWNFLSMENIFYKQNIPVANNQMFPLSTSLTTNYKNLKPVIQNGTDFGIGRFAIFTFLNQASERYFSFPIAQNLITETITGNVNISGKFWFGVFAQPNQDAVIYQCLESEKESIKRASGTTTTTLNVPIDSTFVDTIFYPVVDLPNSLTYNWVYPNKAFNIIREFLALPVAVPRIYKFYIRLYCVYGSDVFAGGSTGMIYNYENHFFSGEPRLITGNVVQVQSTFKLKLEYFIDAFNTQSVTAEYEIPYPKFFMKDLRVVDLEFEVNENFFHINNPVDAKKRVTYLGQRIVRL